MLVSLNWIKKYVDIELSEDALLERIAARIAEIESVVELKEQYQGVLIAEVVEATDHPDADKLGVYQVNIGDKTVQIVAGDKTLKAGEKTAYIPPGVIVPDSFGNEEQVEIKEVNLRGQDSFGMMASPKELGWGDDHTKVLKLDTDKVAGSSLIDAYELDDLIIEIENKSLTHRPDAFGLIGFAREVSGIQGTKFNTPDWYLEAITDLEKSDQSVDLNVLLEQPDLCKRFSAVAMTGIKVSKSPVMMQSYLARLGVKSINNIVDITNYITLSSGQPIHAFDYDKLVKISDKPGSFVVRFPKPGETIALLNGKTIEPRDEGLMICTDTTAADIAGIMGGADTEVSDNTSTIMLSVCNFDLYSIRRTSMKHGLFTEAVTRFIRGQSADQTWPVIWHAARMVSDLSGGKVIGELDEYPTKHQVATVEVEAARVNSLLGSGYSVQQMIEVLQNVEFSVSETAEKLSVTAPFWRNDIHIAEDIVEEIGRLLGYEQLAPTLPPRSIAAVDLETRQKTRLALRQGLATAGAREMHSYNFVSKALYEKLGFDEHNAYEIRNSISPELEFMRMSLAPSILSKVNANIRAGYLEFVLFEINKSHRKSYVAENLPIEEETVSAVYAANTGRPAEDGQAYFQAKVYVHAVLASMSIDSVTFEGFDAGNDDWLSSTAHIYSPARAALVKRGDLVIGVVGELKSSVVSALKLPEHCASLELRLDSLEVAANQSDSKYRPLSKYPSTQQDITLEVEDGITHSSLRTSIESEMSDDLLIVNVEDRDIYRSSENDNRRITFRIVLTHMNRTLTTDEVNQKVADLSTALNSKYGAKQI